MSYAPMISHPCDSTTKFRVARNHQPPTKAHKCHLKRNLTSFTHSDSQRLVTWMSPSTSLCSLECFSPTARSPSAIRTPWTTGSPWARSRAAADDVRCSSPARSPGGSSSHRVARSGRCWLESLGWRRSEKRDRSRG